jgi:DNA-binding beta-propeller fold protein YncE
MKVSVPVSRSDSHSAGKRARHASPFDSMLKARKDLFKTARPSRVPTANFVPRCIGGVGTQKHNLALPWSLTVDKNDNVYVVDYGHERICVFDKNGQWQRHYCMSGTEPSVHFWHFTKTSGLTVRLSGICVDDTRGRLYVGEMIHEQILVIDIASGELLAAVGSDELQDRYESLLYKCTIEVQREELKEIGAVPTFGAAPAFGTAQELPGAPILDDVEYLAEFADKTIRHAAGVVCDKFGNLFVLDTAAGQIVVFDNCFTHRLTYKSAIDSDECLRAEHKAAGPARGVVTRIDGRDVLIVTQSHCHRIRMLEIRYCGSFGSVQKLLLVGGLGGLGRYGFGPSGSGVGEFKYPDGIAVDPITGYLVIADFFNNRVVTFDPRVLLLRSEPVKQQQQLEHSWAAIYLEAPVSGIGVLLTRSSGTKLGIVVSHDTRHTISFL